MNILFLLKATATTKKRGNSRHNSSNALLLDSHGRACLIPTSPCMMTFMHDGLLKDVFDKTTNWAVSQPAQLFDQPARPRHSGKKHQQKQKKKTTCDLIDCFRIIDIDDGTSSRGPACVCLLFLLLLLYSHSFIHYFNSLSVHGIPYCHENAMQYRL